MQLSNIPSNLLNNPGTNLRRSGLGDIWGDLMTATSNYFGNQTAQTIASSQATQATAAAQIAAANAAAAQAAAKRDTTTPLMIGGIALAGLFIFMRMKKRRA